MKDHIDAVKVLLADWKTYYVTVSGAVTYPYLLLWGSSGLPSDENPLAGDVDLTDRLAVTHVAGTPEGVLLVRSQIRQILDGAEPQVEGRRVWLHLVGSERTQVDRSVTIETTDRNPAFGVDFYTLTSVPA